MFTKIWNWCFGTPTPKVLPEALPTLVLPAAVPPTYDAEASAIMGRSLFHKILLEEAESSLKEEREFLNSDAFEHALRKAFRHSITNKSLISAQDLGIKEGMVIPFFKVFSEICKERNIIVTMNSQYIDVDKPSFNAAFMAIKKETHDNLIDDKVRQMHSIGIYR